MLHSKKNNTKIDVNNINDQTIIKLDSIVYGYILKRDNSNGSNSFVVKCRSIGIISETNITNHDLNKIYTLKNYLSYRNLLIIDSISNKIVKPIFKGQSNLKEYLKIINLDEEVFLVESRPFKNSIKKITYKDYKNFVKDYMNVYIKKYNENTDYDETIKNPEYIFRIKKEYNEDTESYQKTLTNKK